MSIPLSSTTDPAPAAVIVALGLRAVARVAGLDPRVRAIRAARQAGAASVLLLDDDAAEASLDGARVLRDPAALASALGRSRPLVLGSCDVVVSASTVAAAMRGPAGLLGHRERSAGWYRWEGGSLDEALRSVCDREAPPTREVPGWHVWLDGPGARREAEGRLFDACRKAVDGLVARTLNRPLSLRISRRAVDWSWSPDRWTVVTFAVGLAGCAVATRGGYGPTLVGAGLMHVASVLDGVDGEVARLRLETSRRGAWLDTLGDDLSNVLFWAALAVGASRGEEPLARWWAVAGAVAAVANLGAAAIGWWLLARRGSGDWYDLADLDEARRGPLRSTLEMLLKQDFFLLLCVGLALVDLLHPALVMMAAAALLAFGNALLRVTRAGAAQPNMR